jgi:multimeric flavodoxin WrbA
MGTSVCTHFGEQKMKIVGIVASPRKKGNCAALVAEILKGAESKGADVELLFINEHKIDGCQACEACKPDGKCARTNGMKKFYDAVEHADAIIFASPIYMNYFTAQAKLFIDRLYAYVSSDLKSVLKNKPKCAIVLTWGNPDGEAYKRLGTDLKEIFGFLGIKVVDVICAPGLGPEGECLKDKGLMKRALEMGVKLAKYAK